LVYQENKEVLTREKVKCPDQANLYECALGLDDYRDNNMASTVSLELLDMAMKTTQLVYFEDSNSEENCVYMIAMNAVDKWVTISFRGSVTKRDFNQDSKAVFDTIDNPIQKIAGPKLPMSEELGVQLGFWEYLYADAKLKDTVSFQKRRKRKEEAPECKYKPENIIAKDRDPVTLIPPNGVWDPTVPLCCPDHKFWHVGLTVKLRAYGYVITYPPRAQTYCGILCCDWMQMGQAYLFVIVFGVLIVFCLGMCFYIAIPLVYCGLIRALKRSRHHHTQLKYMDCLEMNKDDLEQVIIDEMNRLRFERPKWRIPVLRANRLRVRCCGKQNCCKDTLLHGL
jgi:hypothetical protein